MCTALAGVTFPQIRLTRAAFSKGSTFPIKSPKTLKKCSKCTLDNRSINYPRSIIPSSTIAEFDDRSHMKIGLMNDSVLEMRVPLLCEGSQSFSAILLFGYVLAHAFRGHAIGLLQVEWNLLAEHSFAQG